MEQRISNIDRDVQEGMCEIKLLREEFLIHFKGDSGEGGQGEQGRGDEDAYPYASPIWVDSQPPPASPPYPPSHLEGIVLLVSDVLIMVDSEPPSAPIIVDSEPPSAPNADEDAYGDADADAGAATIALVEVSANTELVLVHSQSPPASPPCPSSHLEGIVPPASDVLIMVDSKPPSTLIINDSEPPSTPNANEDSYDDVGASVGAAVALVGVSTNTKTILVQIQPSDSEKAPYEDKPIGLTKGKHFEKAYEKRTRKDTTRLVVNGHVQCTLLMVMFSVLLGPFR